MNQPETPNSKSESHTPSLRLALALAVLSLLAPAGEERAMAQTNYQPIWGSASQSRTASRLGWRGPSTASATNLAARAARQVQAAGRKVLADIGPNHRSWKTEPDASAGAPTNRLSWTRGNARPSVVEIGSGMNFWDGQQWSPSVAEFELTEDAFVANRVQHRKRLNADLNVIGAVTTTLKDGTTLRSTPVAIALYDPNDGRFSVVSTITNSVGVLVESNRVVYAEAFTGGVCADVVYTIQKGSFEQDVIIAGRLNPLDYGFPANAQIQVITEFYDPPQPERLRQPIYVETDAAVRRRKVSPDLVDEMVGFGELVLSPGQAYTPPTAAHPNGTQTAVAKEFRTIPSIGRTFLIETVECSAILEALNALPECVGGVRTAQQIRDSGANDGYAFIPKPNRTIAVKVQPRKSVTLLADATLSSRRGVVIDAIETLGGTISTPRVFQGDITYFVNAPYICNGPVTIEGGAVFKYRNSTGTDGQGSAATTYIQLNNAVTCKTSSYRPAIFTAGDDDSVGDWLGEIDPTTGLPFWPGYTGDTTGKHYANPALGALSSLTLSHCRFAFAKIAVRCTGYGTAFITVSHAQFINCIQGFSILSQGCGSGSGLQVTANNCLLASVTNPLSIGAQSAASATAYLNHCTTTNATQLIGPGSVYVTVTAKNSIFSHVSAWGTAGYFSVNGNNNGFHANGALGQLTFGSSPVIETEAPFYPTTDENGYPIITTYQGSFYLRDGSPFADAGTANIAASLKNDLAQRTTIPPELLTYTEPINSSQVLGPLPIRDAEPWDIGYHYPVVDYVVTVATINNATLNVDQGTVLAFTSPFNSTPTVYPEWGIRLNPGGRLIMHGVPTNRVVFTRIEAIQENPFAWWSYYYGPLIAIKGIDLPSGPVTPLPEVELRYVDFPMLSGEGLNIVLGDLIDDRISGFSTYDLVANVEFEGCLFQNAALHYEAGGPAGRKVLLRNNIFERGEIIFQNIADYHGAIEEQLAVTNNLFYYSHIMLLPVSGANWAFSDNIFDHVTFSDDGAGNLFNGPVSANRHNAYVGMTNRLSPAAQSETDPDLASLSYQPGPLGSFYLPTSATLLVDKGSQLAKDAGLFHFTSFTSNVKEGNETPTPKQVNIGPHYLALVSGLAADADVDGFPDYAEDPNGNGIHESDEPDWQAAATVPVRILGNLTTLSGLTQIPIEIGTPIANIKGVSLIDDNDRLLPCLELIAPLGGPLKIELDTQKLPNGPLTMRASVSRAAYGSSLPYASIVSDPVSVTIDNSLSFPDWNSWTGDSDAVFNLNRVGGSFSYEIWIFDWDYPIARDPWAEVSLSGTSSDGHVSKRWTMGALQDGAWHPNFYTVLVDPSSATILPSTGQGIAFPEVGWWYVAYEDSFRQIYFEDGVARPVLDPTRSFFGDRWFHDNALPGWLGVSAWSWPPRLPAPNHYDPPPNPDFYFLPRTWPIRYCNYRQDWRSVTRGVLNDWTLFARWISDPAVRNLYIGTHMSEYGIGILPTDKLMNLIRHRYHFIFLDGCDSVDVLRAFHFDKQELSGSGATLDYYDTPPEEISRQRPAGAIAAYQGFEVVVMTPLDPDYCAYIPEEVAQFYLSFQSNWTLGQMTLKEALDTAKRQVPQGVPLVRPPWVHLLEFGYRDLRHNEYNERTSWQE